MLVKFERTVLFYQHTVDDSEDQDGSTLYRIINWERTMRFDVVTWRRNKVN